MFRVLKFVLITVLLLLVDWIGVPGLWTASTPVTLAQTLIGNETRSVESATVLPPGYTSLDYNNIPTEKISQFVNAYLKVVDLIDRREGELQSSETESESAQLEQEIEAEAFKAIEQAGLTRQEYLQLLSLANTEPEFGERIADQLQEAAQ